MYHSFLIHSAANGHLGCIHVLAIVNSAVLNTGVHVSLSVLVWCVCPAVGLLGLPANAGDAEDVGLSPGLSVPTQPRDQRLLSRGMCA